MFMSVKVLCPVLPLPLMSLTMVWSSEEVETCTVLKKGYLLYDSSSRAVIECCATLRKER